MTWRCRGNDRASAYGRVYEVVVIIIIIIIIIIIVIIIIIIIIIGFIYRPYVLTPRGGRQVRKFGT